MEVLPLPWQQLSASIASSGREIRGDAEDAVSLSAGREAQPKKAELAEVRGSLSDAAEQICARQETRGWSPWSSQQPWGSADEGGDRPTTTRAAAPRVATKPFYLTESFCRFRIFHLRFVPVRNEVIADEGGPAKLTLEVEVAQDLRSEKRGRQP